MTQHLLKTLLPAVLLCCLPGLLNAETRICRGKDKAGVTLYEPCGENPDPATVVDSKITITMPPPSVSKPVVEKNPYAPDIQIDVKPVPKDPPPGEGAAESEPASDEPADSDAGAESTDDTREETEIEE